MTPEAPLSGRRVLVTRAREDSAALRSSLEELGAAVIELPTVVIEPPEDPGPLDAAVGELSACDWIVFTSRNAVRAVLPRLPGGMLPAGLRVAAVGPSTVRELGLHGIAADCVPEEATSGALADALIGLGVMGARVLIPAGNLARPDLGKRLRDASAEVREVVAYRTVRPRDVDPGALASLWQGAIDAVALASPSALRNLIELLEGDVGPLQATRLVCIGPTTAATVKESGLTPAAVAEEHTLDGLVRAIATLPWEGIHERI
ncbi:MAG: uroporphyrinogen-III synthase [Chloroflexi bacterium]|nr:uroporphyrinogen-III synthase [Chloroflexota bacterium]